ncbi:MAG: ABC-F family ATP-binding cassette domain-containing protein, partial [Ruminococcaceae bacterium]|nr:ABC-F family ATP-binding cassette domain-containing protein [Oscillospiraceae bacterium]
LHIRRGERVFLIGPNGCGKTTLLKILANRLTPRSGYALAGAKVRIGYYDQTQAGLDDSKMVIDEIWDSYPRLSQTEVRNALAAFLFRGEDVFAEVGKLSGGERARILLLKLMLARDNFLLLDEPTNHLDITSCEALEEALSGYDGTVLIVSHDRYFIDRLATRVVRLTENGCESYAGNYTYFSEKQTARRSEAAAAAPPKENAYKQRKEAAAARRKQQTQLTRCEAAIAEAEAKAAALQEQMNDPAVATDYTRLGEVTAEWEETCRRVETLMEEWEVLQLALEDEE